ncbi:hypothetical protein N7472_005000 [Penicillium cf. griseofulvum]|uniref:Uncharacterized protein n=1 Tax=Penicillium cf. griseofulvum TaxID=2972120 RepID=A0A9W9ME47_9EURO|nr:hypothetical protein N7472_005000 [Penicillium cf. griseofulvum]
MGFIREIAYCVTLLGVQSGGLRFWVKAIVAFLGSALLITTLALAGLLVWVLLGSRRLISTTKSPKRVIGRPLLFPATLTHTRVSPVKNKFCHRVFFVGIPIGFRGQIGPFLSIDQDDSTLRHTKLLRQLFTWFSFDPVRYLQRGDNAFGLRDKLDRFLRSQNKNPARWPYAYLMSVPRFLWWERSVVSFWYLYSPSQELDAMIMEINNSFDEKRNVLFQLEPESDKPVKEIDELEREAKYLDKNKSVMSLPSLPSARFYKGVFEKRIFASPFERVEGSISTRFIDPLHVSLQKPTVSIANVASLGLTGESRMVTSISCREPPIDPVNATTAHLAKRAFLWTFPGTLTTPRIIFQALKIQYFQGLMRMMDRPTIQPGSVARYPTSIERRLEPFWRAFLSRCVESFPEPLELTYIPPTSISNNHVCFPSSASGIGSLGTTKSLTIEAVDPGFYTRIINYPDIWEGISHEKQQKGSYADDTSSPLVVSDIQLLHTLVFSFQKRMPPIPVELGLTLANVLAWCRGSMSQMDSFVLSSTAPFLHPRYTECVIQVILLHRLAMDSQSLLWTYGVLVRWMLLSMTPSICSMIGTVPATYLPIVRTVIYLFVWSIGRVAVRAQLFPLSF